MQFSQVENAQLGSRKLQLIREGKIRIYLLPWQFDLLNVDIIMLRLNYFNTFFFPSENAEAS